MDLFKEVSQNKFVLVILPEKEYEKKLMELVKNIDKNQGKICYVCLSKPFEYVAEYLGQIGLDINKFFFIDVLSSHYKKKEDVDNCFFVQGPTNLQEIQAAISKAVTTKNCTSVIFDTLSSLLIYEEDHEILKFTHNFTVEAQHQDVHKVFIVLKEDKPTDGNSSSFVKDISMFAEQTIDTTN